MSNGYSNVEVGDTIEAVWATEDFTARVTGVVDRIDEEGDYKSAGGVWINFNREFPEKRASVVNVVKKAPVSPIKKFMDAPLASIAYSNRSTMVWQKVAENSWGRVDQQYDRISRWTDKEMSIKDVNLIPWKAPLDSWA